MLYVEDIIQTIISRLEKAEPQKTKINIKLSLEKSHFKGEESIKISGVVDSTIDKVPVSLVFINPLEQITGVAQIPVKRNQFTWKSTPGGQLWSHSGEYRIRATYGNERNSDTITFMYEREFIFPKQKTRYTFPIKNTLSNFYYIFHHVLL